MLNQTTRTIPLKQFFAAAAIAVIFSSCGNSKKDESTDSKNKKAKLEKLKSEKNKTDEEIQKLEAELAKENPASADNTRVKLVSTAPVTRQEFQHFIDLQGRIDADNISYVAPRMGPGLIKSIHVKQGDVVKKGQLILQMDDAVARQSANATRQQLAGVKTQLSLASDLYRRQKNLWEQGIGTEVQLLSAKNNMEGLQSQVNAMQEQVKVAEENVKAASVYSDVNGVVDVMDVRVGEIFTGTSGNGKPQIKIVNTSTLKAVTNVPENYVSRVHKGALVNIVVPDAGKNIKATITLVSPSIDATQRGFIAEAKIPADAALKANQSAILKILDYSAANVVVIPVNPIQNDDKGKFVFVLEHQGKDKSVARKKNISIGDIYGDNVEVKSGLSGGEILITEGYQNLYDGQTVTSF